MRSFVIPEKFFKSIAEKGNLYSRLWMYWLGEFVDEILEPDFVEKQVKNMRNMKIEADDIREIHQFGVQFLQQDFKIIQEKAKKPQKPIPKERKKVAEKVIDYLNEKTGCKYLKEGTNLRLISERISDGFTVSDFMVVIDKKVYDWKGSEQEKYLRPITLFSKEKFENYLNGIVEVKKTTKFSGLVDSVQRAKELIGLIKD
jgi:uncharacterized phage protein (TIGR02220 family)